METVKVNLILNVTIQKLTRCYESNAESRWSSVLDLKRRCIATSLLLGAKWEIAYF